MKRVANKWRIDREKKGKHLLTIEWVMAAEGMEGAMEVAGIAELTV